MVEHKSDGVEQSADLQGWGLIHAQKKLALCTAAISILPQVRYLAKLNCMEP